MPHFVFISVGSRFDKGLASINNEITCYIRHIEQKSACRSLPEHTSRRCAIERNRDLSKFNLHAVKSPVVAYYHFPNPFTNSPAMMPRVSTVPALRKASGVSCVWIILQTSTMYGTSR